MGTVVITGSTGKLGSKVAERMKDAIKFNREDYGRPWEKLKNAEIIIHIAGLIHGNFEQYYGANVGTTKTLLRNAPKLKRFIYISTAVENGPYARSKRIAEEKVRSSGIPYVILRPTIIVFDDDNRLLNRLFKLVRIFPVIPLPGGGTQLMQPVWYEDVVECIIKSISCEENKIYNIAGAEVMSLREIIERTADFLGKKRLLVPLPKWLIHLNPFLTKEEKSRFYDDKVYDIKKTVRELDIHLISFVGMLKEMKI